MEKILGLFKGIFASDDSMKVGLSQFKEVDKQPTPVVKKSPKKETKLSDLMRGEC